MRTLLFFFVALLAASQVVWSQTDKALLRQLAEENKKSVEALALYPEDARLAILEASKYPEVLIKMKNAQEKTSAAFRTLIEDFPRSTQTVFYDLTRYPGLIATLVSRQNDQSAMRLALEVLPAAKRDEAFGVADRQISTLAKIDNLMNTTQRTFDQMIAGYSTPAQASFRKLLDLPEVVDILNEDLRFTVLVGDLYKEDPAWVLHKMDSLSLAVAREHADELDNWKKTVENDPQARSEFQSATREYATEYGYTDDLYDIVDDDLYYEAPRPAVEYNYYHYNYPYWFGYPWWAPQPCWRPYPYWWYWGFYPHQQSVVIIYMPSYHFMHWYFWHPHHHNRYNHLSTHFVNHYYGHRHSGTTITMGVGEWRNQNRDIISDTWLSDKGRLPERLREYARFENGRQQFNAKNPTKALTPEKYLEKNGRQYPELEKSRTQAKTEIQRERTEQDRRRSDWAPPKEPVKQEPAPARVPRTDQPEKPKTLPTQPGREPADKAKPAQPTEPAQRPERPAARPQKPAVDEAKEYHRDKWQEPARTQPKTERAPAPQPKQTAPAQRKETPRQTKPQAAPKTEKQRGG